jgi:hypothetical protein
MSAITSVRSTNGHTFMGTDSPDQEDCLTCGAQYRLVDDGAGSGHYENTIGEQPKHCSYHTDLVHGYERHCEADNGRPCEAADLFGDGACTHTAHACDCLLCD